MPFVSGSGKAPSREVGSVSTSHHEQGIVNIIIQTTAALVVLKSSRVLELAPSACARIRVERIVFNMAVFIGYVPDRSTYRPL